MPTFPDVILKNAYHIGNYPLPTSDTIYDAFAKIAKKHGCTVKIVGDYAYRATHRYRNRYKMCRYNGYDNKTGDIRYIIQFIK